MLRTETLEIEYEGRTIPYKMPLGIYLDGKITGKIHDCIIPKYQWIIPEELVKLNKREIEIVRKDATRQLNKIVTKDKPEVRDAFRNTIELTNLLLHQ